MKLYVFAFLVAVCVFENAWADWRIDVKKHHWDKIDAIISSADAQIKDVAGNKGTSEAQQLYERARLGFRSVSQYGKNKIKNCARLASTSGAANVCANGIDSEVASKASDLSKNAISQINEA